MISARQRLASTELDYYPLSRLAEAGFGDPTRLPVTVKILLEGLLRQADGGRISETSLRALTRWPERPPADAEVPYLPARVLLQDFTGVPAVLDLAAMRSAMQRAGKDAGRIDPSVQADLVIDHSVQVDAFGSLGSYARNIEREYERNGERYALLRWAQQAFHNFSVVPPGMGICHQVNLEPLGAGSRHPLQHVPGVRRHGLPLPRRPADPALPGDDRAQPPADRPGRALHPGAGDVPHRRIDDTRVRRAPRAQPRRRRAQR